MTEAPPITPVILSGGAGTRLWPLSRGGRPKQMIALAGAETMLRQTARRVAGRDLFSPPIIVAAAGQAAAVERELDEIGTLILEPAARNTAPAIALAALVAPSDAILLVLPSDHVIRDEGAFRGAVERALPVARDGWLVTFGIRPERPETGYGYIQRGAPLADGVFTVERFVEKPDRATAEDWCRSGDYDWNGGIFLFAAKAYLDALGRFAPDILSAARLAAARSTRDGAWLHPDEEAFAASPSLSIDYAIMEKAERIAVVPVAMDWSDVGSWDALHEIGDPDEAGNVMKGDVLAIDSADCLIHSDGPLVVGLGIRDLVVIATGEAVLVVPRGESQRVREAVEALKARGREP